MMQEEIHFHGGVQADFSRPNEPGFTWNPPLTG